MESKFPAFCSLNQEIKIKFPTYKIRIVNNKMSYNDLRELLKSTYNYHVYEEPNVILVPSLEPVQCTTIHCIESNLDANTRTAEEIKKY